MSTEVQCIISDLNILSQHWNETSCSSAPLISLSMFIFLHPGGWVMNILVSMANSLSWRRETTLALKPTWEVMATVWKGWCLSAPFVLLWVKGKSTSVRQAKQFENISEICWHLKKAHIKEANETFRNCNHELYFLLFMLEQSHKESRICVWDCENMTGRQWELCDDYPSLQAMGWHNNEIGSMQVQSGAWVHLVVALVWGYSRLWPPTSPELVKTII